MPKPTVTVVETLKTVLTFGDLDQGEYFVLGDDPTKPTQVHVKYAHTNCGTNWVAIILDGLSPACRIEHNTPVQRVQLINLDITIQE